MITSSVCDIGHPQKDGRRYVKETHKDDMGAEFTYEYLAEKDTDIETIMERRANNLKSELAASEAQGAEIEVATDKLRAVLNEATREGKLTPDDLNLCGIAPGE